MSLRLLLVEDEAEIAEFIAQGLREEGILVERAADGRDGKKAIDTLSWDLIILDWWLPGTDGLTLLWIAVQRSNNSRAVFDRQRCRKRTR